jgi:hypothetical protein
MSKFNNIVKEALGNTNLTKIQIKTDPAENVDGLTSMKHVRSYTGYLLEEDPTNPMVISMTDIMDQLPGATQEPLGMINEPVEEVKHEGILYLIQKGLIQRDEIEKIHEIQDCETIQDLEVSLRDYNLTDTEILSLYRDYFKPKQCPCHDNSGI